MLWEKEEAQKISGKKIKTPSIRLKFDLYEVCISYFIPCLIYLHAKGGCRLETVPIQPILFQRDGLALCTFDFRASGRSDGQYTT